MQILKYVFSICLHIKLSDNSGHSELAVVTQDSWTGQDFCQILYMVKKCYINEFGQRGRRWRQVCD